MNAGRQPDVPPPQESAGQGASYRVDIHGPGQVGEGNTQINATYNTYGKSLTLTLLAGAVAATAVLAVFLLTRAHQPSANVGGGTPTGAATGAAIAPSSASSSADSSTSSSPTSSVPPASGPVPGVVECAVSYDTLYVRPASITLTCGDGQAGVENMTWTTWNASTATGKGDYFEDPCVPNCADGGRETYPVQVMLSGVRTSPYGTYFSELTITWWEGNVPPNPPAGSFRLMAPTAQP